LAVSFDVPSDLPSQMKFWLEVKIMVSNTSQLIGWTFLFCWSLILKNWLKHACVVYFVLLDVLCTLGCTLHFHFWKYKVHPKVHWHVWINFFYKKWKQGTQHIQKYFYVLLDLLCTLECTLYFKWMWKSTRCTLKHCRKLWFNFLKKINECKGRNW
jgi:hypothetical protein